MADDPVPPERIEGPTPQGGAYALVYTHDDGSKEVVEFEADGGEIRRTYAVTRQPEFDDDEL